MNTIKLHSIVTPNFSSFYFKYNSHIFDYYYLFQREVAYYLCKVTGLPSE